VIIQIEPVSIGRRGQRYRVHYAGTVLIDKPAIPNSKLAERSGYGASRYARSLAQERDVRGHAAGHRERRQADGRGGRPRRASFAHWEARSENMLRNAVSCSGVSPRTAAAKISVGRPSQKRSAKSRKPRGPGSRASFSRGVVMARNKTGKPPGRPKGSDKYLPAMDEVHKVCACLSLSAHTCCGRSRPGQRQGNVNAPGCGKTWGVDSPHKWVGSGGGEADPTTQNLGFKSFTFLNAPTRAANEDGEGPHDRAQDPAQELPHRPPIVDLDSVVCPASSSLSGRISQRMVCHRDR
jgi:hypothetical protein